MKDQVNAAAAAVTAAVVSQPMVLSHLPFECAPMIRGSFTANMITTMSEGASKPMSTDAQNSAVIGLIPDNPMATATAVDRAITA